MAEIFLITIPEEGLKAYLNMVERGLIEHALRISGWNQKKAAEALKIKRTTLIEKIRRLKIQRPLSVDGDVAGSYPAEAGSNPAGGLR